MEHEKFDILIELKWSIILTEKNWTQYAYSHRKWKGREKKVVYNGRFQLLFYSKTSFQTSIWKNYNNIFESFPTYKYVNNWNLRKNMFEKAFINNCFRRLSCWYWRSYWIFLSKKDCLQITRKKYKLSNCEKFLFFIKYFFVTSSVEFFRILLFWFWRTWTFLLMW